MEYSAHWLYERSPDTFVKCYDDGDVWVQDKDSGQMIPWADLLQVLQFHQSKHSRGAFQHAHIGPANAGHKGWVEVSGKSRRYVLEHDLTQEVRVTVRSTGLFGGRHRLARWVV